MVSFILSRDSVHAHLVQMKVIPFNFSFFLICEPDSASPECNLTVSCAYYMGEIAMSIRKVHLLHSNVAYGHQFLVVSFHKYLIFHQIVSKHVLGKKM